MTALIEELTLSAPVNLRDLGGLPVADGKIKQGFAIRADDLAYVTADVAEHLVKQGLQHIIDLRSSIEIGITGRGPLGGHPVGYHHLPLIGDMKGAVSSEEFHAGSYEHAYVPMYVNMFETSAAKIVAALGIMATSNGAVAFHCAAGKDRTGVLAASLLLALGADDATIVADYGQTGRNITAIMDRTRAVVGPMMKQLGADIDVAAAAAAEHKFTDAAMAQTLQALREKNHGDALAPLRAVGLDERLTDLLKARALA